MSSESDIRKSIRAIAGFENLPYSELCKVVSVDEDAMTCEVISTDQVTYSDVRLMADEENSNTGFYLKPKIGSWVMITPQENSTYFVSMYSDLDEIWLHGNQYAGLVKVSDLVTKLNNLENKVNELLQTLSTITIPLAPSGTYPFAPIFASTEPLTPTEQTEIENETVKHG